LQIFLKYIEPFIEEEVGGDG